MKRETTPRQLHMGCGEGLFARMPLCSSKTAKPPGEAGLKPVKRKTGGGRR